MNAQVVFQDGRPEFIEALKDWLRGKKADMDPSTQDQKVRVHLDIGALMELLRICKAPEQSPLRAFRHAVFLADDDRCEMVNGCLAEQDQKLLENLPRMGATPRSLARSRRMAAASKVAL